MLRGLGAMMGVPLLDAMVPAFAAPQTTAAKPVRRLGAVFVPHGAVMAQWTPATEGAGYALTPILAPLAPFRDQLLVLSGLNNEPGAPLPNEGAGPHARCQAAWLTGSHAKRTEGADIYLGTSMDQIAAQALGQQTQLPSLELALEAKGVVGACDLNYACAYISTVAWRSPTQPLPMEVDPRAVFERLFGSSDSTEATARLARMQRQSSILDSVTEATRQLQHGLGARDRSKLGEYFDSVRDVERRIQKAEEQIDRELPVLEQPSGIPDSFEEHAKLMFDLLVLAYQADLTRIATFMFGFELTARTFPEIGVPDPFHPLSHHQNDPQKLIKLTKVGAHHMKMFAYLLERLQTTPDGEGSLLDHTMLLCGSGMSDPNLHHPRNLPTLVAGGGAGRIKGGRHIKYAPDTPLTNLQLTLLEKMGVPMERFGDSTGQLTTLSEL